MTGRSRERQLKRFAFTMLDSPSDWRLRSVERIELTSSHWSDRERLIHVKTLRHVEPLRRQLRRIPNHDGSAEVILPIADFPKRTIFDLTITIDGDHAYRLSRRENAQIQAAYMRHLAEKARLDRCLMDDGLEKLLVAIFMFNPSRLREYSEPYQKIYHWRKWRERVKGRVDPAIDYVHQGLHDTCGPIRFAVWRLLSRRIANRIQQYVPSIYFSAAENPLLAMPKFMIDEGLTCRQASRSLVRLYLLILRADARRLNGDAEANTFLRIYSEYGLRWQAFARCRVSLDDPFTIEVKEQRAIVFDSPRDPLKKTTWFKDRFAPTARHYVSFADAASNHVHIRVSDPKVQLAPRRCVAMDERYEQEARGAAEEKTKEHYSRYDSSKSRPDRLWIDSGIRLSWAWFYLYWGMITATSLSLAMLNTLGWSGDLNSADVITMLLPVTFAGALLLVSDATTLAMHAKRGKQTLLMCSLLILWVLAVTLYFSGNVQTGNPIPGWL